MATLKQLFGIKGDLGKFLGEVKRANQQAVGSQARKNILDDLEEKIMRLKEKRTTQKNINKIDSIQLLLNVMRAKNVPDFNEQMKLWKEYTTQSMNAKFAGAVGTMEEAHEEVKKALGELYSIAWSKRGTARSVVRTEEKEKEAKEAAERRKQRNEEEKKQAIESAKTLKELEERYKVAIGQKGGAKKTRKGRKGSKGRKGKKGTRKH